MARLGRAKPFSTHLGKKVGRYTTKNPPVRRPRVVLQAVTVASQRRYRPLLRCIIRKKVGRYTTKNAPIRPPAVYLNSRKRAVMRSWLIHSRLFPKVGRYTTVKPRIRPLIIALQSRPRSWRRAIVTRWHLSRAVFHPVVAATPHVKRIRWSVVRITPARIHSRLRPKAGRYVTVKPRIHPVLVFLQRGPRRALMRSRLRAAVVHLAVAAPTHVRRFRASLVRVLVARSHSRLRSKPGRYLTKPTRPVLRRYLVRRPLMVIRRSAIHRGARPAFLAIINRSPGQVRGAGAQHLTGAGAQSLKGIGRQSLTGPGPQTVHSPIGPDSVKPT